jgi:hypothetical protein
VSHKCWAQRETQFKNVAQAIVEAGKSKICKLIGWRTREELMLQFQFKIYLLTEFHLLGGGLSRPSTDWMRPNHIM